MTGRTAGRTVATVALQEKATRRDKQEGVAAPAVSADRDASERLALDNAAPLDEEMPGQAAFDRLNTAATPREKEKKQQAGSTLGRVEDLKLDDRYQFDVAEGSFKILTQKLTKQFKPLFDLESFRVTIEKDRDQPCTAHATVKVSVDGRNEITAAEGFGPVGALDNALRKALDRFYPDLDTMRLVDFKVRVIDGRAGTAAKVRVLIETRDQEKLWSTIGVSEDIIEASWQALADSFQFKLANEKQIRGRNYPEQEALPIFNET